MLRRTLLTFSVLAALVACSGIQVHTEHDPGTDFARYGDFTVVDKTPTGQIDASLIENLHGSIVDELGSKGLQEATADADLLVLYHVSLTEELQVNDPYFAYHASEIYTVGTLVLDLVETGSDKLVWTGRASIRLRELKTPEERAERIRRVVHELLAHYPPR